MKEKNKDQSTKNKINIPDHELESLAHLILPEIVKFYANKENMKEFEEWKKTKKYPRSR